jgi:hypothetical protein
LADCDGVGSVLIGDARPVERGQKSRIGARISAARVGLGRRGQSDYGGKACKHYTQSHHFILVEIDAVVLPTLNSSDSRRFRATD